MKAYEITRGKMSAMLKHMYENDITLGIGDERMLEAQETEHILSHNSFERLVKEFLGDEYDFVVDPVRYIISIIDTKAKICVAEFFCGVEYGYTRGDFRTSPMIIRYVLIWGKYVYINGEYVGTIYNRDAVYPYMIPVIYLIDGPNRLLKKYSDGVLLWQSEIPVNYIHQWEFHFNIVAPGMIGITNWFRAIFYNKDTGELNAKSVVQISFEKAPNDLGF